MNTRIIAIFTAMALAVNMAGKDIKLPSTLPQGHPRQLVFASEKKTISKTIKNEKWAKDIYFKIKEHTDVYLNNVEKQPDWLYSRLQMNWKTHFTDVYINGESFDHNGGERAPEPTVKYCGTRGTASSYNRPALENIIPYDDDESGSVTYISKSTPGNPMEKAHPSKTGANIPNVNRQIMSIARDAAFIYWMTGDKRYADMAAKVLDVYLAGIYYRNVPIDLNHGHQQTLVGLTSFEVIHEDIVNEVTATYDFLHDYLIKTRPERMAMYSEAMKKWADNIIANGVPHNNWNLFQAMFIIKIALVLDDNGSYDDLKGRGYYLDYILNKSSIRQWSLQKLAEFGFDRNTGIWTECPGYSSNVVCDFLDVAAMLNRTAGIDLIKEMPVLGKAATAMPQYLFPNMMICGFGDTHPGYMRTSGLLRMIEHAQQNGLKEEEAYLTSLLKSIDPNAGATTEKRLPADVNSFFADKPVQLRSDIKAGNIAQYVSPLFYAPKVSWLAQRNGMDKDNSLMISLNGSKGNHQHANGISMELYGKGYVLGPDGGIGKLLYSGLDYSEYYSQFPAHNTVCVDGVSSYPVMMSQHAFKLKSCYPAPTTSDQTKTDVIDKYSPLTYSEVYFREPETMADQVRTTGIVTVGEKGGYYVDVFRSRKAEGGDKMHDYFYHNLGQEMQLKASDGSDLNLQPTEELAFAGGHLYAYSYIYNKKSVQTERDIKTIFTTKKADGSVINMTMWMKGSANREVFSALSPENEEYDRMPNQPYKLKDAPVLTFIARQKGEAWNHPFISIFEPSTTADPSQISSVSFFDAESTDTAALKSFAGICVKTNTGRTDYIFSAYNPTSAMTYKGMTVLGSYAVINDDSMLLGNGTKLEANGISINAYTPTSVLLTKKDGHWHVKTTGSCYVNVNGKTIFDNTAKN